MAIDPTANINQSVSEVEAAQDPLSAFNNVFPEFNQQIQTTPTPPSMAVVPKTTSNAVDINENIVGNEFTGPMPGAKKPNNQSFVDSAIDYMDSAESWAKDEFKYGRTYSYGAGWKNMDFEHYYTHPLYKKLGFSPYRDNEELYNKNSTWFDDWRRSASQYGKLLGTAFGGGLWIYDGKESSEKMQEAMTVGRSTKDGFGASLTNFGLNGMYTLGVGMEVIVEDIALKAVQAGALALAPETFGASLGVEAATLSRETKNVGRFVEAITSTAEFLKSLKNVEKAKEVFSLAKLGKAAKYLNPLANTTEFIGKLGRLDKQWSGIEKLALTAHGFGHFFLDSREISLVASESSMEGASARSEYFQQLVDEYYAKNGKMPDPGSKDAQAIYEKAASVDFAVSAWNMPAIYLSNKIVFGKYLKGLPNFTAIGKMIEKQSERILAKKAVGEVLEKGAYELTEKGAGKKAAQFFISSPFMPWSREYIASNITEALQENLQDAISASAKSYYTKIDTNPAAAGFWEGLSQFGTGVKGQFGKQGLDTFLSGYFTGMLMGGLTGTVDSVISNIETRTASGKKRAEAIKANQRAREEVIVDSVNSMAQNAHTFNIGVRTGARVGEVKSYADEVDKAANEGDAYRFNSAKDAMFSANAYNLAVTDSTHLFTDHIDTMLKLDDKDLANAYKLADNEVEETRKRLTTAKERALRIKDTYQQVKEEYPNPINLSLYNPEKNKELYDQMSLKHDVHEEAIKLMTLDREKFETVTGRISNIVNDFAKASPWLNVRRGAEKVDNAGTQDILSMVDEYQRKLNIQTLKDEIAALKEGTGEQKKQAKAKQDKIDLLNDWDKTVKNFHLELGVLMAENFANGNQDLKTVEDRINQATSDLYPIFDAYTKLIAKEQGGVLMNKELDNAFAKIRDFQLLDFDANRHIKAINALHNPIFFDRFIQAFTTAIKERKENYTNNVLKGYTDFMGYMHLPRYNRLLNAFYDKGFFIITDDIEAFFRNPRTAQYEVYDIATKTPVAKDDQRIKEFNEIIDENYPKTDEEIAAEQKAAAEEKVASEKGVTEKPVAEEEKKEEVPTKKAISVADDINTMPKDLQDQLIKKFEDLKEYFATNRPDVKFPYPTFQIFLQRSPEAKQIIEAYNTKNDLKPPVAPETKAGVFTPTTPYGTPKGPELTTATKPTESKVEVVSENYTPELLRANPNKLFLFGDNNQRTGKGGQAIIRDEPNAMGISTKLKPSNASDAFMSDDQLANNKAVIDSDIKKAKERATKEGKTIVLPKGGFGTGLAALATKAPQTFAYLNQRLQEEFGFNNTTGELVKPEAKPVKEVTTASIQEVKERLKALNEKTLIVSPSNKKVYVDSQNPEDEYKRVTNLTGDKTFNSETAATRGTIIDALLRRFIIKPFEKEEIKSIYNAEIKRLEKKHKQEQEALGEEEPFVYKEFSDNILENLFNIFEEVSKVVDEKDLTLISDIPTLWGVLNGEKYAGTIDLLGISKTGEVYIIDLKTSGPDRRVHYAMDEFLKKEGGNLYDSIISKIKAVEETDYKGKPRKTNNILAVKNFTKEEKIVADKFIKKFDDQINEYNSLPVYDYKQSDTVQQSAYAELLRQRTGITVKNIVVFPITVKETKQSYTSAIANKDAKGNMTMQVTVDRNFFPEQALSPEASEITEKLEEPVEEAPEWYISPKEAIRNKIVLKLKDIQDRMTIERNPESIKEEINNIENEAVNADLPSEYINQISDIIRIILKDLKSINRIKIGDYIIFETNPSSRFIVVDKNENQLMLYNEALPAEERASTEPEIVTKKDMSKILKVVSPGVVEKEELTPEEKEINSVNSKAMEDFLKNDDAVKDALNSKKSQADIEKGFLDDLDSCGQ